MSRLSLSQAVSDQLLRSTPGSLSSKGWSRIRGALVRVSDPVVEYRIGDTTIRLPMSHNLPYFQKVFPYYSRNLGRMAALVHADRPDLAAVDVGANVGDSAAIIRSETHIPVLAIEGDRRYFALLQANAPRLGPELYLRCVMVGTAPERRRGALVAQGGSAHYEEGAPGSDGVAFETLSQIIGQTTELAGRKLLLKIDTDGLDCMILKAEEELLSRRRPVVFFEYDPEHFQRYGDDGFAVFESLRRAGYSDLIAYENTGEMRGSIGLEEVDRLREMHDGYVGRGGESYADLCVFHSADAELFAKVIAAETEFFRR